jgi:hypothetical protein
MSVAHVSRTELCMQRTWGLGTRETQDGCYSQEASREGGGAGEEVVGGGGHSRSGTMKDTRTGGLGLRDPLTGAGAAKRACHESRDAA